MTERQIDPNKVKFIGMWAREHLIWGPTNPRKTTTAERLEARIRIGRETGSPIELQPSDTTVAGAAVAVDRDRKTKIQKLKRDIRVFWRVRPRTLNELGKPMCSMNFTDECTVEVRRLVAAN